MEHIKENPSLKEEHSGLFHTPNSFVLIWLPTPSLSPSALNYLVFSPSFTLSSPSPSLCFHANFPFLLFDFSVPGLPSSNYHPAFQTFLMLVLTSCMCHFLINFATVYHVKIVVEIVNMFPNAERLQHAYATMLNTVL